MPDLTAFLLARIAEDEQAARSVTRFGTDNPNAWTAAEVAAAYARHTLAECEAKRRIIDGLDDGHAIRERHVLLALATVYADHPDFDETWRVE